MRCIKPMSVPDCRGMDARRGVDVMITPGSHDIPRLPRGVKVHFDVVRGEHVLLAPERAFALD